MNKIKEFINTLEFQLGTFFGFAVTFLFFSWLLVCHYTSNDLLKHSGFYRDGKVFQVVEKGRK